MGSVRKITPELYPSAAELLAQAFFSNPAHVYICPDPERRFAQLVWLLGGILRLHADREASFCLAQGSVVDAMGFWTRSDAPKIGVFPMIRGGILTAPLRLGLTGVRRALEVTSEIHRHRDQALGDQSYWYLNNMVVREELRGTGLGSKLLGEQLRGIAEQEPNAAVALATQRTENVTFYRQLGFEVVWDETIGRGAESFRNWIMAHPAAAQRARLR